ncbi:MAG: response regulator [Candidatus Omnitrophica bacterium]|nr:response regulator [Candidatus Omnitrophota bacterium]
MISYKLMENTPSKKILVVDDDEVVLNSLTEILRRANFEVFSTISGYQAIKLAEENLPDVIILDIILPDIDGGEVAFTLSKKPQTSNIPIIFLTGILKKGEEELIKKSGKHYVLAKPVTANEILTMINKVIGDNQ